MGCLISKPSSTPESPGPRNTQLNEKSPQSAQVLAEHNGSRFRSRQATPPHLQLAGNSRPLSETKARTPSEESHESTSSQDSQDSHAPLIKSISTPVERTKKTRRSCFQVASKSLDSKPKSTTTAQPTSRPAPRQSTESSRSTRTRRARASSLPALAFGHSQGPPAGIPIPQKPTTTTTTTTTSTSSSSSRKYKPQTSTIPITHWEIRDIQSELLDFYTAAHDDPSLTKAFTAGYLQLINHSLEFYPQVGWKGLAHEEKDVFRKYVSGTEDFLKEKENVKWVVMAVISGLIWDRMETSVWLSEGLGITVDGQSLEKAGGGSDSAGRSTRRVDLGKLTQLLKQDTDRFTRTKETEQQQLAKYIHKLLAPFAANSKSREALRLRSLQSLTSKVLDIKILLDVQAGRLKDSGPIHYYRAHRRALTPSQQGLFDATRMERIAGPASARYVQGVVWPALVKGGDGFGGRVGEEGVVLAAMKVLVD